MDRCFEPEFLADTGYLEFSCAVNTSVSIGSYEREVLHEPG